MRKLKTIVVMLLCLIFSLGALACGPTLKETALPHYDYADGDGKSLNTELFYRNALDIPLGDPAVLYVEEEDGGWFYVTGTQGQGFSMNRTKDFTNWEDVGAVYTPPENFFGKSSFWAPQLLFDPEADWQYYLGEDAGEGKGLYILGFSARPTVDNSGKCQVAIAFSKKISGPYVHFDGINADGVHKDASLPNFEMKYLNGLGLGAGSAYGPLYKEGRSFIDCCPFIDPVTGDKYMYMVRSRSVDPSNDVWGVKMKDWVTPDYSTTTALTSYSYTTTEKDESLNFMTVNKIDEGPFVYYKDPTDDGIDNGKYYMTCSIGDTDDKLYPVNQGIGDTPLGPFTKIQPEDNGFVACPGIEWDIHGSGHHAFFEMNGELYIAYHTFEVLGADGIGSRYFACDRVEWTYNEKGQYIMHANGPTNVIQALPETASGYKNVALLAKAEVKGTKDNAAIINDGLISLSDDDCVREISAKKELTVTLTFDKYVTARAIMIYNSYDYKKMFDNVERIEFSYRKTIDGKEYTGIAYIDDLGFNLEHYQVPLDYLGVTEEEIASGEYDPEFNQLRPCAAAIAEFDELEINEVTITIKKGKDKTALNLNEIMILGKTA